MANEAEDPHQNGAKEEGVPINPDEPAQNPDADPGQPLKQESTEAEAPSDGTSREAKGPDADPSISDAEPAESDSNQDDPSSGETGGNLVSSDDERENHGATREDHYPNKVAHPIGEPEEEDDDGEGGPVKSFLEHLEDLRWTIIKSGSSLVIGMIVCLIAAPKITEVLTIPLTNSKIQTELQLLDPLGGFMITLKLAFYTGLVIAIPFILLFVGQFVVPALKRREKKYFFVAFSIGTGFFLLGIILCYFFLLPFSLKALVRYNKWLGFGADMWRGEAYFEFASKFMLGVGLLCEIPVLILTLIRLEVIPHSLLLKGRRYMFVVNFGICAMLTPVDLVTTMLMALGLQVVYEFCILISKYWEKQRRRKAAA